MMGWYGNGMNGWGYALMTVSTLVFLGLAAAAVFALMRYTGRSGQATAPSIQMPAPQQILANRFASGEIDEDEYRRRLQVLTGAPASPASGH